MIIGKDCYKPIKINNAFNGNYTEHKVIGDKYKSLTIKEYNNMIRPYLSDIINDYKTQCEWKTHLTMGINFLSSKNSEETHIVNIKNDNIESMIKHMKVLRNFLNLFCKVFNID